jgi:hypothetical protein
MVEKLTRDRAGLRQTVALFTTMRPPVPESVRPGCRPATRPDVATLRASGPQPAAAIGRAGSNSRKCGAPASQSSPINNLASVAPGTADRTRTRDGANDVSACSVRFEDDPQTRACRLSEAFQSVG